MSVEIPRSSFLYTTSFYGENADNPGSISVPADLDGMKILPGGTAVSCGAPCLVRAMADVDILPFAAERPGWLRSDARLFYDGELDQDWRYYTQNADARSVAVLDGKAVFFPEKAWYDTTDGSRGLLETTKSSTSAYLTAAFDDGTAPAAYFITDAEDALPENPSNGAMWLRRVSYVDYFEAFRYYSGPGQWIRQDEVLYRFEFDGAGTGLEVGSGIEVTYCTSSTARLRSLEGWYTIAGASSTAVSLRGKPDLFTLMMICAADNDRLAINNAVLERRAPDLAWVCRAGDRIWGVGGDGGTVYACRAGDPLTWYCADGSDGDSVALDLGRPGRITGITELGGVPVIFGEDFIVTVEGSGAGSYRLRFRDLPGLARSSPRGVAALNGSLYYRSTDGVRIWDGGRDSVLVTARTGPFAADKATVAAAAGTEVWFCVPDEGTIRVYDTAEKRWYRRGERVENLFAFAGAIYYVASDENGNKYLYRAGDHGDDGLAAGEPQKERWSFTSGAFAPNDEFGCFTRAFCIDAESDGSEPVEILFEWDGDMRGIAALKFSGRIRREIPLPQRFADTVRFSVRGGGKFALRSCAVKASRKKNEGEKRV